MQGEKYTAFTLRQPIGVVAGIVPWNFSLMIGVWKIGSALTTGCTIVLKPSEFASLSLLRLAELAIEAGIPAGVINVVTGKGETGQYLIESPLVKKVSFTGSVPTGIAIGKLAMSSDLTRVSLELGGKNAIAVLADANIDEIFTDFIASNFCASGASLCIPRAFFDTPYKNMMKLVGNSRKHFRSLKLDRLWMKEVCLVHSLISHIFIK